jgi:hypothetical protein
MVEKRGRGAGPTAPPPEKLFPNTRVEHKSFQAEPQAPLDADSTKPAAAKPAEPICEPDRRSSDWAVQALVGALQVLTGERYLREFRLFSTEDREIERVRGKLRAAIVRRKRNLRKRVRS